MWKRFFNWLSGALGLDAPLQRFRPAGQLPYPKQHRSIPAHRRGGQRFLSLKSRANRRKA